MQTIETSYDNGRGVVRIGSPLEVKVSRREYDAIQEITINKFGDFYTPDNNGRIRVSENGIYYLNASELGLTDLHESIGELSALEELYLDGNKLTKLPESIGKLSALKKLDLDGNKLTALSESIGKLSTLKKLDLSGNQLTTLLKSIGDLSYLRELDLSGNPKELYEEAKELIKKLEIKGVLVYK